MAGGALEEQTGQKRRPNQRTPIFFGCWLTSVLIEIVQKTKGSSRENEFENRLQEPCQRNKTRGPSSLECLFLVVKGYKEREHDRHHHSPSSLSAQLSLQEQPLSVVQHIDKDSRLNKSHLFAKGGACGLKVFLVTPY